MHGIALLIIAGLFMAALMAPLASASVSPVHLAPLAVDLACPDDATNRTTIFIQIKCALGPAIGGGDIAGFLLGFMFLVTILIGLLLMFGTDVLSSLTGIVFIAAVIVLVSLIGWWPLWVVLFMAAVIMAYWLYSKMG